MSRWLRGARGFPTKNVSLWTPERLSFWHESRRKECSFLWEADRNAFQMQPSASLHWKRACRSEHPLPTTLVIIPQRPRHGPPCNLVRRLTLRGSYEQGCLPAAGELEEPDPELVATVIDDDDDASCETTRRRADRSASEGKNRNTTVAEDGECRGDWGTRTELVAFMRGAGFWLVLPGTYFKR